MKNLAKFLLALFTVGQCVGLTGRDIWQQEYFHRIKEVGKFSYRTDVKYLQKFLYGRRECWAFTPNPKEETSPWRDDELSFKDQKRYQVVKCPDGK